MSVRADLNMPGPGYNEVEDLRQKLYKAERMIADLRKMVEKTTASLKRWTEDTGMPPDGLYLLTVDTDSYLSCDPLVLVEQGTVILEDECGLEQRIAIIEKTDTEGFWSYYYHLFGPIEVEGGAE